MMEVQVTVRVHRQPEGTDPWDAAKVALAALDAQYGFQNVIVLEAKEHK